MPFLDPSENFDDLATFMKLITALGAIGGAGYWAYTRVGAVLRRTFAR